MKVNITRIKNEVLLDFFSPRHHVCNSSSPSLDSVLGRSTVFQSIAMLFDRVFVTVGTTEFNELVDELDGENFLQFLHMKGCRYLTLQLGRGKLPSLMESLCEKYHIAFQWYRFKDNLQDDLHRATLIISHAGAGTIMECLEMKKILIVCVNTTLMNNHQTELAEEMALQKYCIATVPEKLVNTLSEEFHTQLRAYPDTDFHIFPKYLNALFQG